MKTIAYFPLRDALRCDRLLRALARRAEPDAPTFASDHNIFKQSTDLVQSLIHRDPYLLPLAVATIRRLKALGFQRQDPEFCFIYLFNCLTALDLDIPLTDDQLYEFILFFCEFQRALQEESDREFEGFFE